MIGATEQEDYNTLLQEKNLKKTPETHKELQKGIFPSSPQEDKTIKSETRKKLKIQKKRGSCSIYSSSPKKSEINLKEETNKSPEFQEYRKRLYSEKIQRNQLFSKNENSFRKLSSGSAIYELMQLSDEEGSEISMIEHDHISGDFNYELAFYDQNFDEGVEEFNNDHKDKNKNNDNNDDHFDNFEEKYYEKEGKFKNYIEEILKKILVKISSRGIEVNFNLRKIVFEVFEIGEENLKIEIIKEKFGICDGKMNLSMAKYFCFEAFCEVLGIERKAGYFE